MTPVADPRLVLSSIVDAHPRFWAELVLWVLCVTRNLPRNRVYPVIYCVADLPDELISWIQAQGVEIRIASPLIPDSPHSNKIIPFADDWTTHPFAPTHVAVADLDLFFVSNPLPFLGSNRFRAAPNNHNNPPPQIWRNLLNASGLGRHYRAGLSLFPNAEGLRETHVNNVSAGFVVAPTERSANLAESWEAWARWLVSNRALLCRWSVHIDQVAFALAMEQIGEDVEHLPATLNVVLHLLRELQNPVALHLTTGHIPAFPEFFASDGSLQSDQLRPESAGWVPHFNDLVREASRIIESLPALQPARSMFLNPGWKR